MIRENIDKNRRLLEKLMAKAGVSQRACAANMGEYDTYLVNYIYRFNGEVFPRSFAFHFLSSIYHSLIRDKDKNRNEKFRDILNEASKPKFYFGRAYDPQLYQKLLIPALEYHVLAMTKIDGKVFNMDNDEILENYI